MIRRGDKILSLIFILLFLASCSTKRKAVVAPVDAERMEFVNTYQKLSLAKNGKKV